MDNHTKQIYPDSVFFTWDIHYSCNYSCTYCFLHFERDTANIKAAYLDSQNWQEIWRDIYKRYGACHIHVTGGEPFTYPHFIDLVDELSKMHTFEFSTNLSFDAQEFVSKVKPERVKLSPSFHPEFASIGTFINKYLQLKEKGYLLGVVTFVGYPPFLKDMLEYRQLFLKSGIEPIVYPYRGPYQNRAFPKEYNEQERELLVLLGAEKKVSKELMDSYNPVDKINVNMPQQVDQEKLCGMGHRYSKVLPSGEAFRCCAAVWNPAKTWENWGSLGNITNKTFRLSDSPQLCTHSGDCVCYKAMIVGEEDKRARHWKNVEKLLEYAKEERVLNTAKVLRDASKLDEAIEELKEFLLKHNSVKTLTLLGEIYTSKGDFVSAQKILDEALAQNQEPGCYPWIYRSLGRLCSELILSGAYGENLPERKKMFARGVGFLDKAITSAQENDSYQDKIWSIYEKARINYIEKNYAPAKEAVEMLLGLEPGNIYFKELSDRIEVLL